MLNCRDVISAGDVVAHAGRHFLVVDTRSSSLLVVPIGPLSEVRHRADVALEHWTELEASGLQGRGVVVSCRARLPISPVHAVRTGAFPASVMLRVRSALAREAAIRAMEAGAGLGCSLAAQTASSGRRVGAVRYS